MTCFYLLSIKIICIKYEYIAWLNQKYIETELKKFLLQFNLCVCVCGFFYLEILNRVAILEMTLIVMHLMRTKTKHVTLLQGRSLRPLIIALRVVCVFYN